MKTLKQRLEQVMTEKGWDHADLVRVSGQSSSVVSQWLGKGSKTIHSIGKMEAAERIEAESGYCALWIAKGKGPERVDAKNTVSDLSPYTVNSYSDTKSVRAPVVVWARLGTDLYMESKDLQASLYLPVEEGTSSKAKWFIVESAMPRFRITQGDRLLICPIADDRECRDGKLYVFQALSGEFVLAEFRRLVGGYEAIPDSGSPLESGKHGIKVVGKKLAQYDAD